MFTCGDPATCGRQVTWWFNSVRKGFNQQKLIHCDSTKYQVALNVCKCSLGVHLKQQIKRLWTKVVGAPATGSTQSTQSTQLALNGHGITGITRYQTTIHVQITDIFEVAWHSNAFICIHIRINTWSWDVTPFVWGSSLLASGAVHNWTKNSCDPWNS